MSKAAKGQGAAMKLGVGRRTINPSQGHSLAGYFNERPNTGVHDDLWVKVLLVESQGGIVGLISYDLILLSDPLIARIRAALAGAGYPWAGTIPLAATHTHTGPDVGGIFDLTDRHVEYQERVAQATVEAAREALGSLRPAEAVCGRRDENPFAFNRRFWMKSGRVVTNPGIGNPEIVREESAPDRTLEALGFRDANGWRAIVVNVSNHTDTVGTNEVSADWPGRMEAAIRAWAGPQAHVFTLIRPAGNINHVNVRDPGTPVYAPEIAERIGAGYAETARRALAEGAPVAPASATLGVERLRVSKRTASPKAVARAKALIAEPAAAAGKDLTSEDLARGSREIERVFAVQLVEYLRQTPEAGREFDIALLSLGRDVGILFVPGEPFVELTARLLTVSPFRHLLVAALSNGECGYVAPPECFDRGGYEVLPVVGGGPHETTLERMVEAGRTLMARASQNTGRAG